MRHDISRRAPARRGALAFRSLLLAGGAVLAFGPAVTAQAQEAADTGDRVVVTGSRIARTGMSTPTPVTTVSADELQQIAPGNLVEVFDALPQFLGNEGPQTALNFAGSAGASNLNMRGLESKRALVLLDGRRMVSSNRLGTIDISVFPEAVIERVEVVTGGASAAYGSDAVAGVTNFILDTDFEGFEGKLQGGISERGDNENVEASVTYGTALGDRMHVIGSFEYFEQAEVKSWEGRDWYDGWGIVTNPAWTASGGAVGPQRITAPNVVATNQTWGGMLRAPGSSIDRYHFLSDGTAVPFVFSSLSATATGTSGSQSIDPAFGGGSGTNIQADPERTAAGSVSPKIVRKVAFGYADFDVTDNFTIFAQGIYGDSSVDLNNGTTVFEGTNPAAVRDPVTNAIVGYTGTSYGGTVFVENPFLPDNIRNAMIAEGLDSAAFHRTHSSADLAQGRMRQTNRTLSLTTGFRYDVDREGLFQDWTVDGYYQYGRNKNHIRMRNFIRTDRLAYALDAVAHPVTGAPVCNITLYQSGFDDCVPINLFGAGQASDEAIDYVLGGARRDKDVRATVRQDFAELSASGELFDGFGAGPVSLAFGGSYRKDSFDQRVGPEDLVAMNTPANNPALGIRGVPPLFATRPIHQFSTAYDLSGSFDVWEGFAETLVPLVRDVNFVRSLDLSAAARYADYSGSGGVWAWKTGLDWQVTDDLRLRGTLSRDVRAGTLSERFDQQGQGTSAEDPVFGNARFNFSQIQGGNPNVDPEKADTLTFGGVYIPSWFEGLSMSVDYYDIKIDGAIDLLGVQRIIDDCFEGAAELCNLITRDAVTNELVRVDNIYQNVDEMRVKGVDIEVSYRTSLGLFGSDSLQARVLASFLDELSTTNAGAPPVDAAGAPPAFDKKVTGTLTYLNGPLRAYIQGRYLGEAVRNATWVEGVDIDWNDIKARFYTDIGVNYIIDRNDGSSLELYGNVQNLFDVEPPLAPNFLSGFSDSTQTIDAYDVIGRRFTAGVRVAF